MTAGQWQDMFIYSAYIGATSLCALSFTFTSVWSFAPGLTHSSDLHPFLAVDCNFKPVDEGWQSLLVHLRGRGGGVGCCPSRRVELWGEKNWGSERCCWNQRAVFCYCTRLWTHGTSRLSKPWEKHAPKNLDQSIISALISDPSYEGPSCDREGDNSSRVIFCFCFWKLWWVESTFLCGFCLRLWVEQTIHAAELQWE